MPKRALIERRPWMLGSMATAIVWMAVRDSDLPGVYLMLLQAAPLVLLAVYAVLRHKGQDTRSLAGILGLQGVGISLLFLIPVISLNMIMIAYLIGLSLFLMHRHPVVDGNRKIAAAVLTMGTPLLCYIASERAGIGLPLFLGLALGGMAAAAWISTFPQGHVGLGASLIVVGNILAITALGGASGIIAFLAWPLIYIGNLMLAIGITGELRLREEYG